MDSKPSLTRRQLGALFHWAFAPYYKWLVVLAVLTALGALAEAIALVGLVDILATIASKKDIAFSAHVAGMSISLTIENVLFISIGVVVARTVVQLLASLISARLYARNLAHMREMLFNRFMEASWDVQSRESSGQLQNLLTHNATMVMRALVSLSGALVYGVTFLILIGTALAASPFAVLIIIVVAGTLFVVMRPISERGQQAALEQTEINKAFAHHVTQAVGMAREIRTFGVGAHYRGVVDKDVEKTRRNIARMFGLANIVPTLYQNLSLLLVLGGTGVIHYYYVGNPSSLGITVLLLIRALTYSQGFQSVYHGVKESAPFLSELRDMERRYHGSKYTDGGETLAQIEWLGFEKVNFSYTDAEVTLKEVDFRVTGGEIIGVVGPSGAGKSTFIQLLLRLRVPQEGAFLVNGTSVHEYSLASWYNLVTYVPQEAPLADETIFDNIAFHRPGVTQAHVEEAARLAHIHDEIMSWPAGYQTMAGDRGASVSGGQRQRICIARALANRPAVIIFDEPTSALDMHSESAIQQTLEGLRGKVTLFIIAHRLSTLSICDRIMVFNRGKLQAFGPAAELGDSNPYYSEALKLSGMR